MKLGSISLNSAHIAAILLTLLSLILPSLLPAGSLQGAINALGVWGPVVSVVIMAIARSISPAVNVSAVAKMSLEDKAKAHVGSALPILLLAAMLAVGSAGCAKGAVSPNTVQGALTVEQYACVVDQMLSAALPAGTVEEVAAAIQQGCADLIPQSLTALIVQIIEAVAASMKDAKPEKPKWLVGLKVAA